MKKSVIFLLIALALPFIVPPSVSRQHHSWLPRSTDFLIRYPRCGRPALVVNGMDFLIQVNTTYSSLSGWSVQIRGVDSGNEYGLTVVAVTQETSGTRYIYNLTVRGNGVPPELYNLTVSAGGHIASEPRAIAFYNSFPDTFNFTVINDIRIGDPYTPAETVFNDFVTLVNILRPAFVIVLGDLVYNTPSSEYPVFYNILQKIHVPTFVIPGNHEYYNGGMEYYDSYFYWHYYSWTWGDKAYFIAFDTGSGSRPTSSPPAEITADQRTFAQNDIAAHSSYPLKFALLHVPSHSESGDYNLASDSQSWFDEFVTSNGFTMVFAGHTHIDREYIISTAYGSVPQVETTSLGAYSREASATGYTRYWGFRVISVENGSISHYYYTTEVSSEYKRSEPMYVDASGNPASGVATPAFAGSTSGYANDGTERYVRAKIRNSLHYFAYNLSYIFKMPKLQTNEEYVAQNGIINEILSTSSYSLVIASAIVPPDKEVALGVWINDTSKGYVPPSVTAVSLPPEIIAGQQIIMRITVNECNPPVSSVQLHYVVGGVEKVIEMKSIGNNIYEITFTIYSAGTVEYWFVLQNVIGTTVSTTKYQMTVKSPPQPDYTMAYIIIGITVIVLIAAVAAIVISRKKSDEKAMITMKIS